MFHGSSGNGERFLRISGWREQADRTGLIAVFPTGLRYRMLDTGRRITKWNSYNLAAKVDLNDKPPGYPAQAPWPANDVGFVDAMLGDLGAAGRLAARSTPPASRTAPSSPPGWRSSAPTCSPRPRTRPAASTRRARSRRGQIPLYMTVGSARRPDRRAADGPVRAPAGAAGRHDGRRDAGHARHAAAAVRRHLAPPLDRAALAGPRPCSASPCSRGSATTTRTGRRESSGASLGATSLTR